MIAAAVNIAMPRSRRVPGTQNSDRVLWKSFRVSERESLEIEAKADAAGMNVSDLIRSELLDSSPELEGQSAKGDSDA